MFWKYIKMKRFLIIYWLICSASAAMPDAYDLESRLRLVTSSKSVLEQLNVPRYVTEMIFRHHSDKTAVKDLFEQHSYPKEETLDNVHEDISGLYDRGYALSVEDPFFLICCGYVARLVDTARLKGHPVALESQPVVLDVGCGNGNTTVLLSLLGANTIGFEVNISSEEAQSCKTFIESARKLARTLNQNFVCNIKIRDVTKLDRIEFPGCLADVVFMGCFLHMFDPFTAKKIVKDHILRMIKSDGVVFATVDGIGSFPEIQQIYQQGKANHAKFPTVFCRTSLRIMTQQSPQSINTSEHIEGTTRYLFDEAIVDDEGHTAKPCRQHIVRQAFLDTSKILIEDAPLLETVSEEKNCKERELFARAFPDYPTVATPMEAGLNDEQRRLVKEVFLRSFPPVEGGTEIKSLIQLSTIFCAYDTRLINYVFPSEDWDISLEIKIPIDRHILQINLGENPDITCKRWHITARKKQTAAAA